MMKDNAARISAADKEKLATAAAQVKEALKGTDAAAIKTASEHLNETWQTVSKELYKSAETPGANRGAAGGQSGGQQGENHNHGDGKKDDEPVIDAEVVEEPLHR
jgi:molecular chaperone DnaK